MSKWYMYMDYEKIMPQKKELLVYSAVSDVLLVNNLSRLNRLVKKAI